MSGTFYTGRNGSLKIGGKLIAKIRDWSIETTVELISTNTVDSAFNTFVPGVAGATGSATVLYYKETDTERNDFSQFSTKIMKTAAGGVTTSDKVTFLLKVQDSDTADVVQFDGYITSMGVQVSTGEVTSIPISFTVDDKFTRVPS